MKPLSYWKKRQRIQLLLQDDQATGLNIKGILNWFGMFSGMPGCLGDFRGERCSRAGGPCPKLFVEAWRVCQAAGFGG